MKQLVVFVIFATIIGVGTHFSVKKLDQAVAKQCATHDWPTDKHQVHMVWCAANNYPTN